MKNLIRAILIQVALRLRKNKSRERQAYPQLWHCWPRFTKRIKWIYKIRTKLCGLLTGHEISKTEWGYGGGKYVDHNCRWCDNLIQLPIKESPAPTDILAGLLEKMKEDKSK